MARTYTQAALATAPYLYRDQFGTVTDVGSGPSWFFTGATIVG
jgi:hypothetical protein